MSGVVSVTDIPSGSIILKDFGNIDYKDTYKIQLRSPGPIDHIITDLFKMPGWVDGLMSLRNALVKSFGIRAGVIEDTVVKTYYSVGERAVYFTVFDRNENEIVMAEDDKHLNFRLSVFLEHSDVSDSLLVSTIVHYNNFFGKLYFFFVRPFHKLIVKSMLKRYANENK